MSHDVEAAYASSEVANMIMDNQDRFFGTLGTSGAWSVYAGREGGYQWPLADAVILAENTTHSAIKIAFEYKRPNEGVHGILTALGQSFAYLDKGYDASIMVIPDSYSSHSSPGEHIKRIIESTSPNAPISIYTYTPPDLSVTRPFQGKLRCVREISLPDCAVVLREEGGNSIGEVSTMWAHMREGVSHPDAFFKFCQGVKIVTAIEEDFSHIVLPDGLVEAVHSLNPEGDVFKYLSHTTGDTILEKAWRYVWFNYYFWEDLIPIWKTTNPYTINRTDTKLKFDENHYQTLFVKKKTSKKPKLIENLNKGIITEEQAWKEYAEAVHDIAHSYREDIDSGVYHTGFVDSEGALTELGYKYVEACERVGTPYIGVPKEIFRATILQNGQYGAMLHYFYKLSEAKFKEELFAFTEIDDNGKYIFKDQEYLKWLDDIFANELRISKKSTQRAGGTRTPFQAELTFLKKMGFVKKKGRSASYRVGVGLEIDWPQVQSSMLFFQTLCK